MTVISDITHPGVSYKESSKKTLVETVVKEDRFKMTSPSTKPANHFLLTQALCFRTVEELMALKRADKYRDVDLPQPDSCNFMILPLMQNVLQSQALYWGLTTSL